MSILRTWYSNHVGFDPDPLLIHIINNNYLSVQW